MDANQNQEPNWGGAFPGEDTRGFSKGKIFFLFVIGFLLGVSIKAQAIKSLTIGYDDYKVSRNRDSYLAAKQAKQETKQADDSSAVQEGDMQQPQEDAQQDSDSGQPPSSQEAGPENENQEESGVQEEDGNFLQVE